MSMLTSLPAVDKVRELGHFLTGSNGPEVERCTRTCLPACLRGGQGTLDTICLLQ